MAVGDNLPMATVQRKMELNQKAQTAKNKVRGTEDGIICAISSSKLDKFFLDAVKDIYWAEKHLIKALPKLQKAVPFEELQQGY